MLFSSEDQVKILKCGSNNFTDSAIENTFIDMINNPVELERLSLLKYDDKYEDKFTPEGVKSLIAAYQKSLESSLHLKRLDVSLRLPSGCQTNIFCTEKGCKFDVVGSNDLEKDFDLVKSQVIPSDFFISEK